MVNAGFINKIHIIIRKLNLLQNRRHAKLLWILSHWRMRRHCKLVPEAALQNAHLKQLPNHLKRVNRFLNSLGRVAVHQISVNHNSGLGKMPCNSRYLFHRNTFVNEFQKTVAGNFQSTRNGDAAREFQQER